MVGVIEYHRGLLADELRTNAYREAISRIVKPGDVVVDIGCGSGILSFFACQAGASKVYAIDRGDMAGVAQYLAEHLGFADRITVLRDESTSVDLPERADVLITETLGVLGLDENILGSVIDARARLLRPGASILPRRVELDIVPVELPERYATHVAWWNKPRYGLDLRPMSGFASNSPIFLYLPEDAHVTRPETIIDIDLTNAKSTFVRGRAKFAASNDCVVHGFGVWFTATLADDLTITNRETRATQHWAQAFLPLEQPVALTRGAHIDVDLETDDGKGWRWRGKAGAEEFDQTTLLSAVPYHS